MYEYKTAALNHLGRVIDDVKQHRNQVVQRYCQAPRPPKYDDVVLPSRLNIGQLNCRKNVRALDFALRLEDDLTGGPRFDILLISEPPVDVKNRAVRCGTPRIGLYYADMTGDTAVDMVWAAVAIINPLLRVTFKQSWANPFVVTVLIDLAGQHVKVTSVYIHTLFPSSLDDVCTILQERQRGSIIGGDFNTHLKEWNDHRKTRGEADKRLHGLMRDGNWTILNARRSSTWFRTGPESEQSTIDYTLVTHDLAVLVSAWKILGSVAGTDHQLIHVTMEGNLHLPLRQVVPPSHHKVIRHLHPNLHRYTNFTTLIAGIREVKRKLLLARDTVPEKKNGPALATTRARWTLVRKNINRLRRRSMDKGRLPGVLSKRMRMLKEEAAHIQRQIETEKWSLFKQNFNNMVGKNHWMVAPIGKRKPLALDRITVDGVEVTDKEDMVQEIMKELHRTQPTSYVPWRNDELESCPDDEPLSAGEVITAAKSLKPNKAAGQDGVSGRMARTLILENVSFFHRLYMDIYDTGDVPEGWKETRLVVIPKKNVRSPEVTDIRPVGISSFFAKVLEKICLDRLRYQTRSGEPMAPCQASYAEGKSATQVLEEFHLCLFRENLDGGLKKKLVTKFDIKGAFEGIRPGDALDILVSLRFPKKLIRLLANYLQSRKNTLTIGDHTATKDKFVGTIQGAITSPFLFDLVLGRALKGFLRDLEVIKQQEKALIHVFVYVDDVVLITEPEGRGGDWFNEGVKFKHLSNRIIKCLTDNLKRINLNLSMEKSKHMLWPSGFFTTAFNQMDAGATTNILAGDELSFLGIKLSLKGHQHEAIYDNHVNDKLNAGRKDLASLRMANVPGYTRRKDLVEYVILQSLFYAVTVWQGHISERCKKNLGYFLADCMRYVVKARRDMPLNALSAVSTIAPAHLTIRKMCQRAYSRDFGLYMEGQYLPPPLRTTKEFVSHPAATRGLDIEEKFWYNDQIKTQEDVTHLYTDAALNDEGGGLAAVNLQSGAFMLYSTPPITNSFELETRCILEAVRHSETLCGLEKKVTIFTDSLTTLAALENRDNKHQAILQIRHEVELARQNKGTVFNFAWVKGHTNILGNQVADFLAAVAQKIGPPLVMNSTTKALKKRINDNIETDWELWYKNFHANSFSRFYPSLAHVRRHLRDARLFVNITSSHSDCLRYHVMRARTWGKYKHKADPGFPSPFCECDGRSEQDGWHLIFLCPFLDHERRRALANTRFTKDQILVDTFGPHWGEEDFYYLVNQMAPLVEPRLQWIRDFIKNNGWQERPNSGEG